MTKIEQVAQSAYCRFWNYHPDMWAGEPPHIKAQWLGVARAVIEAMRVPTSIMINAAYAETDDLISARAKWEAMINAALQDGGT